MNIFGKDLFFLRRNTNSGIHAAVGRESTGEWVTGCNLTFAKDALADNLVARRPAQLPGPQTFCKRCAKHFSKLDRVHSGEVVKDV